MVLVIWIEKHPYIIFMSYGLNSSWFCLYRVLHQDDNIISNLTLKNHMHHLQKVFVNLNNTILNYMLANVEFSKFV